MKPIDETKGLVTEITNPVRSAKRRRMKQHAGSSAIGGIRLRETIAVVKRQIVADRGKSQDGVAAALAPEQRNSGWEVEASEGREESGRGGGGD